MKDMGCRLICTRGRGSRAVTLLDRVFCSSKAQKRLRVVDSAQLTWMRSTKKTASSLFDGVILPRFRGTQEISMEGPTCQATCTARMETSAFRMRQFWCKMI